MPGKLLSSPAPTDVTYTFRISKYRIFRIPAPVDFINGQARGICAYFSIYDTKSEKGDHDDVEHCMQLACAECSAAAYVIKYIFMSSLARVISLDVSNEHIEKWYRRVSYDNRKRLLRAVSNCWMLAMHILMIHSAARGWRDSIVGQHIDNGLQFFKFAKCIPIWPTV